MKFKIRLKCFDKSKLNTIIQQLSSIFEKFSVDFKVIRLPTDVKRWCLEQATFKFEDSKRHHERLTYNSVILVNNPENINMHLLSKFKVFPAINISVKFVE